MEFFSNPLHLMLLIVVIVLLFGASKLGDVGGALGKSIREFKKEASVDDAKPQRASVPPASSAYVPPAGQAYSYDQVPPAAPPVGYVPSQPVARPDFAPGDYRPGAPQNGVPAQPVNVPPDNFGR